MITSSEPTREYFPPSELRIGQSLARSVRILFSNPFFFVGTLAGLPGLALLAPYDPHRAAWLIPVVSSLVSNVVAALCQAVVVYGTLRALSGHAVDAAGSARRGLARPLPVLGAWALSTVIVVIGALLLVVPGVIAAVTLVVVLPACVVERLGPFASLSRSAELTSGQRGRIFLLMLLLGIVEAAISFGLAAIPHGPQLTALNATLSFVWDAIGTSYYAVLATVVYFELRVVKERIGPERIDAVFE